MTDTGVEILSYFFSHIDAKVKGERVEEDWRFMAFMAILILIEDKSLGSC